MADRHRQPGHALPGMHFPDGAGNLRHYSRHDHWLPGNGLFMEPWIPNAR